MARTSSKQNTQPAGVTLMEAMGSRDEYAAVAMVNGELVTVWAANYWYWVVRGRYTTNERYQSVSQVLMALGFTDGAMSCTDPAIWQRREAAF